jgi:LmbE family N-acetylglucosaminyl deacetylase
VLDTVRKALVIAPHPDDEVLGVGGTISRLTAGGASVHVAVVTTGRPPRFPESQVQQVRAECGEAHRLLGVDQTHFLDFPAAELDGVSGSQLNQRLTSIVDRVGPDLVFVPFVGDVHLDHQLIFNSALVACRPRHEAVPKLILAYETLSETNWYAPGITPAFVPNVFVDISDTLDAKIAAFGAYRSQHKSFPDERSIETIRSLATVRGSTVYRKAAEAFMLVRHIV